MGGHKILGGTIPEHPLVDASLLTTICWDQQKIPTSN